MKRFIILFVLMGSFFSASQVMAQDEREAAKAPLNDYLQAQSTGNPELIRKAFFPDARIMAFSDEKLTNLSVEEFAARFNGKAAADEAMRKREITDLNVSGNAASAKIVLDYPNVKFTDYMNLLKINGEWKIVNKSFYRELKEEPKK